MSTPKRRFQAFNDQVTDLPLIAVDLGYSAKAKTCGFASSLGGQPSNCMFGHCIQQTADAIKETSPGPVLLVLEAVLSMRHDACTGNPIGRSELERGREWYRQPGVVTFASALRFLDVLQGLIPARPKVYVAEAFLSNKPTKTSHASDAATILLRFWKVPSIELPDDCEPASPHVRGVPSIREF